MKDHEEAPACFAGLVTRTILAAVHNGSHSPSGIATATDLQPAFAASLLSDLEAEGLLEQEGDAYRLTQEGLAQLEQA